MKKSLGAMVIAIFVACTVGAVPPSWGDDSGAAGFSCVSPPALGNDSGAAGFSLGPPTTSLLSNQTLSSTRAPSLGHPAGAVGVGSISSGMVFHGFYGAATVNFEQHSSASGNFSFSTSYKYESQLPSSGITDLFSGFFSFP